MLHYWGMEKTRFTSIEKLAQAILTEWWIPVAVVVSMIVQLILLLTGTARKRSSVLRIVAWNAYNWSDHVATLALGGMVQNAIDSGKTIYAIWAPILLLHLGCPDNISAYALEDNELWRRHGLLMIVHVLAALFVVINSARGSWHYMTLTAFLMLVGPLKYAERTLALRRASKAAIVEAVLPIYKFMRLEPVLNIPIRGAYLRNTDLNNNGNYCSNFTSDHYFYIIRGESQWHRRLLHGQSESESDQSNNPDAYLRAIQLTSNFVTLEDILANPVLSRSPRIRHICIAFALFKLYRRRFFGIHMDEWEESKTRRFFLNSSGDQPIFGGVVPEMDILSILNLELEFIFDSLYTKSSQTAFTKLGIFFRMFTTLLLIASSVMVRSFIVNTDEPLQEQMNLVDRLITFLLLAVALFVEITQIIRLLRSDWIAVWLACTYLQLLDKEVKYIRIKLDTEIGGDICKCLRNYITYPITRNVKSLIVKLFTSSDSAARRLTQPLILQECCGLNCLGQYAFIDDFISIINESNMQQINNSVSYINQPDYNYFQYIQNSIYKLMLMKSCNHVQLLSDPQLLHDFTLSVVRDILRLCCKLAQLVQEKNIFFFTEYLSMSKVLERRQWRESFQHYCVFIARDRNRLRSADWVILSWHLATTVCELLDAGLQEENQNSVKWKAKILSRYVLYLLLNKGELLPCQADVGRRTALDVQKALRSTIFHTLDYMNKKDNNQRSRITSCSNSANYMTVLMQTLIMESPDLRLPHEETNVSNNIVDEDVEQVLLQIYRVQCQYDEDQGICTRFTAPLDANFSYHREDIAELRVPQILRAGLMAGKLLLLGISDREHRWSFIWEFWIEILERMASVNSSAEHLKQLTMGGEFLTHIWLLLGHMGFGRRT